MQASFFLGMWGIVSGLDQADSQAVELQANLQANLVAMAEAAPGGREHVLVQRAELAYERRFGEFPWPEEVMEAEGHHHTHGDGCSRRHQDAGDTTAER
jgi:ABC-type nickel/cobalt efflux system permease component RcnA